MPKFTLNTISSMANQAGFLTQLNQNFSTLSNAIDDAVSRTGLEPNQLESDIDANSYTIINLPDATGATEPVTYGQFQSLVAGLAVEGGYAYEPVYWTITGNGVDTVYPMANAPLSTAAAYRVSVAGSVLNPDNDYTVSSVNEKITFAVAPNGEVSVVCLGFAVPVVEGSVAVNAVGTVQLQNGSVTTLKIASGALSADVDGRARMANGYVNTAKIEDGAVTTAKLAASLDFTGITVTGLPSAGAASESTAGVVEIATSAEARAFTANKVIDGAKLADAFTGSNQSLGTGGYQKLPGGLIIQWGYHTGAGGAVTFPTAFPTACVNVQLTVERTDPYAYVAYVHTVSASGFSVRKAFSNSATDGNHTNPVYWLAIGY